jgi:carnitine O-palmitoyltransferase 2
VKMRCSIPCLCAATTTTTFSRVSPGVASYASGNWAALRDTVSAASTDTVKALLTPSLVPTRHFQRSLPRLPLPSLNETLQRYLAVVRPLCSPSQHEATTRVVTVFKQQEGARLQDELRRTDKANLHTSFISSDLFERRLRERHPLPLLSHKTWLVRPDDEKADMLVRSAYWLWASVLFYKLYLDNKLEPEVRYVGSGGSDLAATQYWRKDWFERTAALLPDLLSTPFVYNLSGGNVVPLDMSQFDCLFNCSRMPGVLQDEIKPVGLVPQVTVQYRGHQFVITVADADCAPLSVDQLYAQLRDIVETRVTSPRTDVSVFTALPRSEWNGVRTMLLRDAANSKNVETIEESMFVLNLDDEAVEKGDGAADPLCAAGVLSKTPSLCHTNRWWDKSLSVSVNHRGAVAVSAEASWGDEVAVRRYIDDVYALSHAAHSALLNRTAPSTYPVRQLQWHISSDLHGVAQRVRRTIEGDKQRLDVAAGVLDVSSVSLSSSVEGTLQLAAQLAWWRLQHRPTCCFQTLDMQRYRRGRTEQICLTTPASTDFVLSMLGKDSSVQRAACQAALRSYETLKNSVGKGQGIQSHLLALRMTAERLFGQTPALYRDAAYGLLLHGGVCVDTMDLASAYGRGFSVNPFGYHLSCSRSGNSILYQVSNMPSSTCAVPTSTSFAEAFKEACRDVDALQRPG